MKKIIKCLASFFLLSTLTFASATVTSNVIVSTDSPARKVGNLVFISGQGAGSITQSDPDGAALSQAFQQLSEIAKNMGGSLNDVVKLTVYMADVNHDYPLLNKIVPKYFKYPYPARSTVGVANLPKGHRVEVDAIMALK